MISAFALALVPVLTLHRAQVEITPPEPLALGGYTKRMGKLMEPGGEPLYARAVAIEQGPTKATLISLEMLTVPESLVREVKKQLPDGMNLMLVATHTHCAPDSQMLNDRMTFSIPGIASFKSKWLEWYSQKIAEAAKRAWETPGIPVEQFGVQQVELKLNRGRRKDANPDPVGTFLEYLTPAGEQGLVAFSYAAHGTLFGDDHNQTSGDWPGAVSADWSDVPILPGAIGDVSPVAESPKAFAAGVRAGFSVGKHSWTSRQLKCVETPIALGPPTPHPDFAKSQGIPEGLAKTLCKKFAPTEAKITSWRLGTIAILGIPGEPTSHLGRALQALGKEAGFQTTLVISHVNGWVGYILEPDDYDRGGYEATLAMHGRDFSTRIKDAAKVNLRNLMAVDADK